MSKGWSGGSTRRWRTIRKRVLLRDRFECRVRTRKCTGLATHVHHVLGKDTTADDPRYLVASCAPCNLEIGRPNLDPPATPPTTW